MAPITQFRRPPATTTGSSSSNSFTKMSEPAPGLMVLERDSRHSLPCKVLLTAATLCAAAAALYIIWTPVGWWGVLVSVRGIMQAGGGRLAT